MKTPASPREENARLRTLRSLDILDTSPEERFDRLTRMAKRMFGVPIALVSLVDENRQWFKSCIGLGVIETPRDISFCGHAILGSDIFVIPDATQDERFADNPLVLDDPYIRFYAGCPLSALNGKKLGTLWIIDQNPRHFGEDDMEALRDLASMAERELAAVQLATQDDLTHISNRRGFMLLAQHSISICNRHRARATLVFFDLNNFKSINDKFGHAEGDSALVAFAEQLNTVLRDADLFARLGGDEFVVLLTDTPKELAKNSVARFKTLLDTYNKHANRGYDLTFSHGIVEYNPDTHRSIDSLLAAGDTIMYEDKMAKR